MLLKEVNTAKTSTSGIFAADFLGTGIFSLLSSRHILKFGSSAIIYQRNISIFMLRVQFNIMISAGTVSEMVCYIV